MLACRGAQGGFVLRRLSRVVIAALALASVKASAQTPAVPQPPNDLDALMSKALQKRDVDRRTLSDYVLDEIETFEVLGPGRAPLTRLRREYTWYVRDGIHVRSPVRYNGVPIGESERREYEDKWFHGEQDRRKERAEREAKREAEGKQPALGPSALNEPRFVSESYFLEFKFEPGNYYLAGRVTLDKHDVFRIDYFPTNLFDDDEHGSEHGDDSKDAKASESPQDSKASKKHDQHHHDKRDKDDELEQDINRKMNKTAKITLWVDPSENRIVKYTFDNVWMDFLPAAWLIRIDDIRASMEMGQPFEGVWLPRTLGVHGGVTLATGSLEIAYRREFSNYRKADVTTRITVPKQGIK
jgi:hypothetical protein